MSYSSFTCIESPRSTSVVDDATEFNKLSNIQRQQRGPRTEDSRPTEARLISRRISLPAWRSCVRAVHLVCVFARHTTASWSSGCTGTHVELKLTAVEVNVMFTPQQECLSFAPCLSPRSHRDQDDITRQRCLLKDVPIGWLQCHTRRLIPNVTLYCI